MTLSSPTYSSEILPNFIVIEGLDGAGTSTQSKLLERNLIAAGRRVVLSEEPTPGPIGTLIRQIMRGRLVAGATREDTEILLAHLFAADRQDHLANPIDGIRSHLDKGAVCLSTRYYFSSMAYNGRDAARRALVERLNADFPQPALVVYLEVPVEVSLARLDRRDVLEFYEKEEELRRVAEGYESALAPLGERVLRYRSDGPVEEVAARIAHDILARISPPPTP